MFKSNSKNGISEIRPKKGTSEIRPTNLIEDLEALREDEEPDRHRQPGDGGHYDADEHEPPLVGGGVPEQVEEADPLLRVLANLDGGEGGFITELLRYHRLLDALDQFARGARRPPADEAGAEVPVDALLRNYPSR